MQQWVSNYVNNTVLSCYQVRGTGPPQDLDGTNNGLEVGSDAGMHAETPDGWRGIYQSDPSVDSTAALAIR